MVELVKEKTGIKTDASAYRYALIRLAEQYEEEWVRKCRTTKKLISGKPYAILFKKRIQTKYNTLSKKTE